MRCISASSTWAKLVVFAMSFIIGLVLAVVEEMALERRIKGQKPDKRNDTEKES